MFENKVGRLAAAQKVERLLPMILRFLYYLGFYVKLWTSFC